MEGSAFYGCDSLEEVYISETVERIGENAFPYSEELSWHFAEPESWYVEMDGEELPLLTEERPMQDYFQYVWKRKA